VRPLALTLALLQLTVCAASAEDADPAGPLPAPRIYGVLAAGAATLASAITASLFHRAADGAYRKYRDAATYADAQKYRNDTEKLDRWRNIAIGTTGAALVVTGYAFWRYRADRRSYEESALSSLRESPGARRMQVSIDLFTPEQRTPIPSFAPHRTRVPSSPHGKLDLLRAGGTSPAPPGAAAMLTLDGDPAGLPWRGDDRILRQGFPTGNRPGISVSP
jgi:hypothetical protein